MIAPPLQTAFLCKPSNMISYIPYLEDPMEKYLLSPFVKKKDPFDSLKPYKIEFNPFKNKNLI